MSDPALSVAVRKRHLLSFPRDLCWGELQVTIQTENILLCLKSHKSNLVPTRRRSGLRALPCMGKREMCDMKDQVPPQEEFQGDRAPEQPR